MTTTTQEFQTFNAGEILRQLGGNRFIAMTGAKNFTRNDATRAITFQIGRNAAGINYVRITLNGNDTYDTEFLSVRAGNIKVKSSEKDVYCDQLESTFTEHTGLYTRF